MKEVRNILAIIPARAGSKGVPRKNVRLLAGKPMIAWTIEAAVQSADIDRVIVTTDSEEIAEIARNYGAEVPFLRPDHLADDKTPMFDVVLHTLKQLKQQEDYVSDCFVLLQPTCPLRTANHINEAIVLFRRQPCSSVVSVCEVNEHPYWMKTIVNNELHDFDVEAKKYTRRQDLPKVYKLNGSIYVHNTTTYLQNKDTESSPPTPYIMDKTLSIDIDTPLDFQLAELLMNKKK